MALANAIRNIQVTGAEHILVNGLAGSGTLLTFFTQQLFAALAFESTQSATIRSTRLVISTAARREKVSSMSGADYVVRADRAPLAHALCP